LKRYCYSLRRYICHACNYWGSGELQLVKEPRRTLGRSSYVQEQQEYCVRASRNIATPLSSCLQGTQPFRQIWDIPFVQNLEGMLGTLQFLVAIFLIYKRGLVSLLLKGDQISSWTTKSQAKSHGTNRRKLIRNDC
jgi:hypothetical protein